MEIKGYKKYYDCQDWTIEQIARAFKGADEHGRRIIVPLFQRGKRWDAERKKELISSLRNGFPVGSMLFSDLGNKRYSIVDGLQRGSTICDFIFSPTSMEHLQKIDEEVLDEIRKCLFPLNENKTINKEIENKIFKYFSEQRSFSEIQIYKLVRILIDEFPNQNVDQYQTSIKLSDILEPWFKVYKDYYEKIAKAEIPVVVYTGDENHLNTIFRKINEQGLDLTEYEIYASSWKQYRKVAPEEIVNFVLKKYDILLRDGYEIQDYSPEILRTSKELQPFEYLFGLGKWLSKTYGDWLRTKSHYKDDEICEIGFEIVNICLNNRKEDVADLDKRLEKISFTNLFRRIKEAIDFTFEAVKTVSAFKGNSRKINYLHGQRQILSMVGFVFREMYSLENLEKKRDTWKDSQKKLSQNLLHHYVYDIINGYWAEGSEKPYMAIREKKYNIELSKNAWHSLLNSYFESSLQKLDTQYKVGAPTPADKVILNCIYLDLFTAKDQLGNGNFDIEHLATKKLMQSHLKNTGMTGLPIASIGNQCYLPELPNRSKREKTIYQKYGENATIIEMIENKYSFTKKEDLEWIELPFENLDTDKRELKMEYENFLRRRFDIMLKKFLNALEIIPIVDWDNMLRTNNIVGLQMSLDKNETNVAGTYSLNNIETDLTWSAISKIIIGKEEINVTTWKSFLNTICQRAYVKNQVDFARLVSENKIHKSVSNKNPNGKDPIITNKKEWLVEPMPILGSQYYSEGCISGNRARFYACQLAEYLGFANEIKIEVRDR